MNRRLGQPIILAASLAIIAVLHAEARATEDTIVIREALAMGNVGSVGRRPIHTDAIQSLIVRDRWTAPTQGDVIRLPDGSEQTWQLIQADESGWFSGVTLRGGYVFATIDSDSERIALLDAAGHNAIYVNGVLRTGDPYNYGFVSLPVQLNKGANTLLFQVGRGRLRASVTTLPIDFFIDTRDATLPDLITGEPVDARGAVVIVNATQQVMSHITVNASSDRGHTGRHVINTDLLPLSIHKIPFRISGEPVENAQSLSVNLNVTAQLSTHKELETNGTVELVIVSSDQLRRQTFVSDIDGSVQYYAILPAAASATDQPGLILTLHGAGVEAYGQARSYAQKNWAHIVAPTNRRKFGFDWEDWGRLDAMEVLAHATGNLSCDPLRVYLTGHSMGGHGAWHLGATFPDRFAAIAPSAGWISFRSYTGGAEFDNTSPIESILSRAAAGSDTLGLLPNLMHPAVYVLHGDADDNVPVAQARQMRELLESAHGDFAYHEQAGAGHWWDGAAAGGADCVDWPPMMELFQRCSLPVSTSVAEIDFTTVDPGISSEFHWAGIIRQIKSHEPSRIQLNWNAKSRVLSGQTKNVQTIFIDAGALEVDGAIHCRIDGDDSEIEQRAIAPGRIELDRMAENNWRPTILDSPRPMRPLKRPQRAGPFKAAFASRMVFVYGTRGTDAENQWSMTKARLDAETFWYRGNGSIDIVSDREFVSGKVTFQNRNVIIYGNADTNTAWTSLLYHCPVQITRDGVRIGDRGIISDDLACLLVYPRPDSDAALVGVVAGTGLTGMRVTDRLPYFVSGVAYPDCIVIDADALETGTAGVHAAGFFGNDWTIGQGEFAFRDSPKAP